jgi:hypothetical protein
MTEGREPQVGQFIDDHLLWADVLRLLKTPPDHASSWNMARECQSVGHGNVSHRNA